MWPPYVIPRSVPRVTHSARAVAEGSVMTARVHHGGGVFGRPAMLRACRYVTPAPPLPYISLHGRWVSCCKALSLCPRAPETRIRSGTTAEASVRACACVRRARMCVHGVMRGCPRGTSSRALSLIHLSHSGEDVSGWQRALHSAAGMAASLLSPLVPYILTWRSDYKWRYVLLPLVAETCMSFVCPRCLA
jgi:hypothetical protein